MKTPSPVDELRQMLDQAERDDALAAQAWLACRGIDALDAGPLVLVGALREVRQHAAIIECAKALRFISGWIPGRKE